MGNPETSSSTSSPSSSSSSSCNFFSFLVFCLFNYVLATRKKEEKNTSEHRKKRLKNGLFQSEVYIGILS